MVQPSDMICYINSENSSQDKPDIISSTLSFDNKIPGKIKRKNKNKINIKPTFSRPLIEENLTPEQMIRKYAKFNKKLLTKGEQEQLINKLIEHREALSIYGEVGRSKSYAYSLKMKPDFVRFFRYLG